MRTNHRTVDASSPPTPHTTLINIYLQKFLLPTTLCLTIQRKLQGVINGKSPTVYDRANVRYGRHVRVPYKEFKTIVISMLRARMSKVSCMQEHGQCKQRDLNSKKEEINTRNQKCCNRNEEVL